MKRGSHVNGKAEEARGTRSLFRSGGVPGLNLVLVPRRDGPRVAFVGRARLQRETASAAAVSREYRGLLAEPG